MSKNRLNNICQFISDLFPLKVSRDTSYTRLLDLAAAEYYSFTFGGWISKQGLVFLQASFQPPVHLFNF